MFLGTELFLAWKSLRPQAEKALILNDAGFLKT